MITLSHFQIALAVQVLRERSTLSPNELAMRAGLPRDEITQIEAGETRLDYLTATRVAQVLRINLAEIATTAYALDPAEVSHRYERLVLATRDCQSPFRPP